MVLTEIIKGEHKYIQSKINGWLHNIQKSPFIKFKLIDIKINTIPDPKPNYTDTMVIATIIYEATEDNSDTPIPKPLKRPDPIYKDDWGNVKPQGPDIRTEEEILLGIHERVF